MKKIKEFLNITFLFLTLFFVFSCQTVNESHDLTGFIPDRFQWESVNENISITSVKNENIPLIYHITRIRLSSDIEYCTYNANTNDRKLIYPSTFSESSGADIVFNTLPFSKENNTLGIHKENGKIISSPLSGYDALGFYKDTDTGSFAAKIIEHQNESEIEKAELVLGGYWIILKNNVKQTFRSHSYDSRTAVGISEDGSVLYLLSVEGEYKWVSCGLGFQDCAEIFMALDCPNAIEFDGGGSTCLYVNGKNRLSYFPSRKGAAFLGISYRP